MEPLFNKIAGLLKRDSKTDVSGEHCKIFENTYFEENLRTTDFNAGELDRDLLFYEEYFLNVSIFKFYFDASAFLFLKQTITY